MARLTTGRYVNSLHLLSVQLLMFFMVIHLWGKFFMAAWRGGRALTWITGAVCSSFTAIGTPSPVIWYSRTSIHSGSRAGQGTGAQRGRYRRVLQRDELVDADAWHIVLLPFVLGLLTAGHILLVRRRNRPAHRGDRPRGRRGARPPHGTRGDGPGDPGRRQCPTLPPSPPGGTT